MNLKYYIQDTHLCKNMKDSPPPPRKWGKFAVFRRFFNNPRRNRKYFKCNRSSRLIYYILDTKLAISALNQEAIAASASKLGHICRFSAFFFNNRRRNRKYFKRNGSSRLIYYILDTKRAISASNQEAIAASASKLGQIRRFSAFFQVSCIK